MRILPFACVVLALCARARAEEPPAATPDSALTLEAARLAVTAGTTKAFVAVLTAQERVRLAREMEGLAEETATAVTGSVGAGAAAPVNAAWARVAREQAERALDGKRTLLAATWGGTHASFPRAAGDLDRLSPVPAEADLAAARERLAQARDEAAAVHAAARAALVEARLELADAHATATALATRVLPEARRSAREALAAFRQGAMRPVDVLEARRALVELEEERRDALRRCKPISRAARTHRPSAFCRDYQPATDRCVRPQ